MSVYFATAGAYVKIGFSDKPISRVSTVTTSGTRPADLPRATHATLLGWIPGDRSVEAGWHRRFADDHVAGEWFYLEADTMRELIWADPRGVDIHRMTAKGVFAALAYPTLTREQIASAGVAIEAVPMAGGLFGGAA